VLATVLWLVTFPASALGSDSQNVRSEHLGRVYESERHHPTLLILPLAQAHALHSSIGAPLFVDRYGVGCIALIRLACRKGICAGSTGKEKTLSRGTAQRDPWLPERHWRSVESPTSSGKSDELLTVYRLND
jgi:hypothetical protein